MKIQCLEVHANIDIFLKNFFKKILSICGKVYNRQFIFIIFKEIPKCIKNRYFDCESE